MFILSLTICKANSFTLQHPKKSFGFLGDPNAAFTLQHPKELSEFFGDPNAAFTLQHPKYPFGLFGDPKAASRRKDQFIALAALSRACVLFNNKYIFYKKHFTNFF